jgi:hypothetical protein
MTVKTQTTFGATGRTRPTIRRQAALNSSAEPMGAPPPAAPGRQGPALSSGSCMKPTNRRSPKAASRRAWAPTAASWPPAAMSAQQTAPPPKTRLSQPSNRNRPWAA